LGRSDDISASSVGEQLGMDAGPAGAWIGTSEFADTAGFAAAEAMGDERAVYVLS